MAASKEKSVMPEGNDQVFELNLKLGAISWRAVHANSMPQEQQPGKDSIPTRGCPTNECTFDTGF